MIIIIVILLLSCQNGVETDNEVHSLTYHGPTTPRGRFKQIVEGKSNCINLVLRDFTTISFSFVILISESDFKSDQNEIKMTAGSKQVKA